MGRALYHNKYFTHEMLGHACEFYFEEEGPECRWHACPERLQLFTCGSLSLYHLLPPSSYRVYELISECNLTSILVK